MPTDLATLVAEKLNLGPDELMERALELRGSPARGPASWARDRFGLAKRLLFAPLRIRRRARPLAGRTVVFDVGLSSEYQQYRAEFVRTHFAEEVDFVSASTPRRAPGGEREWGRWYRFGIGVALRALLDFSERRYFWLGQLLLEVQALALASPGIETAYVFRLFDRRPYLAATYLARHTGARVLCVFQNIPLWRNCRYFHLDVPVVLTSRVNEPEVDYLANRGFFRASERLYRSQEFVHAMPAPSAPSVDIGFFSSGEWARRDGLYQSSDVEAVRRGEFIGNPYAEKAEWLVSALATYARDRGKTLRVYPHPYERILASRDGIAAPWMWLADGEVVSVASEGADSRGSIYEARAAVSLQSSFIWERLDLGLDASFIYDFADDDVSAFKRESLGRYAANVFSNETELFAELDRVFG